MDRKLPGEKDSRRLKVWALWLKKDQFRFMAKNDQIGSFNDIKIALKSDSWK